MATYDITVGGQTILVATSQGPADHIVAFLEGMKGDLRSMEGIPFAVVETDRDRGDPRRSEPVESPESGDAYEAVEKSEGAPEAVEEPEDVEF